MLSDEVLEKVTERIVNRIEKLNTNILKQIGSNLDEVSKLTPTKAQQLVQTLKYGGDYNKIIKELSKVSKLTEEEIKVIFNEVAKKDYRFAKQFYDYRSIGYIPYDENIALKNQVQAIANITAKRCADMIKPKALGFGLIDNKTGQIDFKGLKKAYYDLLDEAVLGVSQGKETFDQTMQRQIKEMGSSGLKLIYDSTYINKDGVEVNRHRRLDTAIRMNLKDSLRELHNETQKIFGEEFNADGVEISVHENPAPDHEDVQGKQFSIEEFNNFQNDIKATSYDGIVFEPEKDGKDRRSISEYNCYHYIFSIVLGVSTPEYTNKELKSIKDRNNEGFELDGKHYTRYEGTQMQRQLETKIREQKDIQIMAKASGQDNLVMESQKKIVQLTQKYKELSKTANLPTKMNRLRVVRLNKTDLVSNSTGNDEINASELMLVKDKYTFTITKEQQKEKFDTELLYKKNSLKYYKDLMNNNKKIVIDKGLDIKGGSYWASNYRINKSRYDKLKQEIDQMQQPAFEEKTIKLTDYDTCKELLSYANIEIVDDKVASIDNKLLIDNTTQMYNLVNKYPKLKDSVYKKKISVKTIRSDRIIASTDGMELNINRDKYNDYDKLIKNEKYNIDTNWHTNSYEENIDVHSITHEFGHIIQKRYSEWYSANRKYINWEDFDKSAIESIYSKATKKTGLKITELKNRYLSDYGKSKRRFEAFAEIFAQLHCGKPSPLTEAMQEYLEEVETWKK